MSDFWRHYALRVWQKTDENGDEWIRGSFRNDLDCEYATAEELLFGIEVMYHILNETDPALAENLKVHVNRARETRQAEMKTLFDKIFA